MTDLAIVKPELLGHARLKKKVTWTRKPRRF